MYNRLLFLSTLLACLFGIIPSHASQNPYIVIDADSGTILAENRADHRWYPASLTKLMTAYVTFRAIQAGAIEDGSPVEISRAATRQPPSRMGYKRGVKLRVDTALRIIIIKSANDVSLALAEAVAGTLENFVSRMNAEATRLGLNNTRFANSNGLHNASQYSSARDMALLSARILQEFPQYAGMFSAVAIKTPAKTHYSYNLLLERFPGSTGMKTGFVCASGYNMVASARIDGRHLIAVVLGRESQTDRAVSAAKLITTASNSTGTGSVYAARNRGAEPTNMRPVMCSDAARAARYDPGAGAAVIKSEHLQPRRKSANILSIVTGGVDTDPSDAWLTRKFTVTGKVPVPSKRPDYDPLTGKVILVAIGNRETGRLPVPTPRPR
ncbi:MAG: D-alanyl-D-alanine carboxypeptidase family protein [Pseudomonadota bacterium]